MIEEYDETDALDSAHCDWTEDAGDSEWLAKENFFDAIFVRPIPARDPITHARQCAPQTNVLVTHARQCAPQTNVLVTHARQCAPRTNAIFIPPQYKVPSESESQS